jgi:NADH dehydrogenase FAD-containing subunit
MQRVIIVGGGYAGAALCRALDSPGRCAAFSCRSVQRALA